MIIVRNMELTEQHVERPAYTIVLGLMCVEFKKDVGFRGNTKDLNDMRTQGYSDLSVSDIRLNPTYDEVLP